MGTAHEDRFLLRTAVVAHSSTSNALSSVLVSVLRRSAVLQVRAKYRRVLEQLLTTTHQLVQLNNNDSHSSNVTKLVGISFIYFVFVMHSW